MAVAATDRVSSGFDPAAGSARELDALGTGPVAPLAPRSRKAKRRWPYVLLLLLLVAAAAAWYWRSYSADAAAPAYATAPVRRATVEDTVSALGNIQPREFVDVGTQVSGQLRTIKVEIGQQVSQGDLLAEIDPTVYQARVEADRAQRGNLGAQLKEREARLVLATQQLQRQQRLRRANATSDEALEQAEADVHIMEAQIASLKAQIGQLESQLKGNEANLGYTRIFAPMTGTIVSIAAKRGQTLNANQSAPIILRIADLSTMTVWTQVSEADVGRLVVGQEAYFTTLGNPDHRYVGTLKQVMPTPETVNNVILYNSLFDVPNPDGALMTQMTAQVFFVIARAESVLSVPASALRDAGDRSKAEPGGKAEPGAERAAVLVKKADGSIERRQVEIGVSTRTRVEVKRGLAEGEEVVIGPPGTANGEPGGQQRQQPGAFRARLG